VCLLIYSFKLKFAFDARSLLLMPVSFYASRSVLLLNDTSKISEEVNRKCLPRNTAVKFSPMLSDDPPLFHQPSKLQENIPGRHKFMGQFLYGSIDHSLIGHCL